MAKYAIPPIRSLPSRARATLSLWGQMGDEERLILFDEEMVDQVFRTLAAGVSTTLKRFRAAAA
ncbi:MAG: hypothetical protein NXI02_31020 [Rhodobacteraceae bacterium]|nr:hypothetical protein [Paracoccaceae bacterium]